MTVTTLQRAPTTGPARPAVPLRLGRSPTWLGVAAVVLPTLAVLTVQAWNISGWPAGNDDEGTYLSQAWSVQQGHGLAPYTYWYDHPPLGWLQIAALSWLPELFASHDQVMTGSLRTVMLPITAISCVLLYLLARRLGLPRWAGSLAVLLFGLSPLAVSLQRQVLLDNLAVMWVLAAMVLCASPRRDLWQHTAAGLAFGVAVLSKETIIVLLPALVLLLWQRSHPATRGFSLAGAAGGLVTVLSLYPLYALLKNELVPGSGHVSLLEGLSFQLSRPGSPSLLAADSANRQILDSWLYYDRFLLLGGLAAAVLMLLRRPMRPIGLAAVLLAVIAMRPGYLPAMFVIQALPFLALALAGTADRAVVLLRRGTAAAGRRLPPALRRPLYLTAVALTGLAAVSAVAPGWYAGDRTAVTADANDGYDKAAQWLRGALTDPATARVAVDNVLWMDLVRDGLRPGLGAIWFYKIDLDPAVARELPGGWKDLDYIVSTPTVRQPSNSRLTTVQEALAHSTVAASFGSGDHLIEIRRIVTEPAGEGP
ncbi:ArnT family glycosyltransferase [Kitasatospora camelliae]|uniref:Glycosyltransferase family 39 protein n=1 Tax=Kitasatospora camelliae TaxID=3156397 RepID=A0AAU8K2X5_9ACTN